MRELCVVGAKRNRKGLRFVQAIPAPAIKSSGRQIRELEAVGRDVVSRHTEFGLVRRVQTPRRRVMIFSIDGATLCQRDSSGV